MNREVRDILIRVLGSSRDAEQKLNRISRKLAETSKTKATPRVELAGVGTVERQLGQLAAELKAIDGMSADAHVNIEVDRALTRVALLQRRLRDAIRTPAKDRDPLGMSKLMADAAKQIADIGGVLGRSTAPAGQLNAQFSGMLGAIKQVNPVLQGMSLIITGLLIPAFVSLAATIVGAVVGAGAMLVGFLALLGPLVLGVVAVASRISAIMQVRQQRQQAMNSETRKGAQADEFARQRAEALRDAHNAVRDAGQQRTTAVRQLRQAEVDAQHQIAAAQEDAADAARQLRDATVEAYADMKKAIEDVYDAQLSLESAQLGIEEAKNATARAKKELADYAKQAGITTEAFNDLFQKFTDVDFNPQGMDRVLKQARARGQLGAAGDDPDLRDKILDVARARLNEKEAIDRAKHATNDLADARRKEQEYARKGISAYEPYITALRRSRDANRDLAEAQRQGVAGNPQVIAAHEAVRDAIERQREALHNLQEAHRRSGQSATEEANGPLALYKKGLGDLSDEEKRFLDTTIKIGKAFRAISREGTNRFLAGLNDGIQALLGTAGPGIQQFLSGLGSALGGAARDLGKELATPEWQSAMVTFGDAATRVAEVLAGPAFRDFLAIMRNIALAVMPSLLDGVDGVAGKLKDWRAATDDIGKLRERLQPFLDALSSVWGMAKAVAGALLGIGQVGGENTGLMDWLTEMVETFTAWLNSAEGKNTIKAFFEDVMPAVKSVIQFVGLLIVAAAKLLQFLAPALKFIVDGFNLVLKAVIFVLDILNKIPAPIRALLGAFFPFGGVLRPILGLFGRLGAVIVRAFGPVGRLVARVLGWFGRFAGLSGRFAIWFARVRAAIEVARDAIFGVVKGLVNGIFNRLGFIRRIADRVRRWFGGMLDGTADGVARALNAVLGVFRAGINLLIDALNFVIRALDGIHIKVPKWVPHFGGKEIGFNIGQIAHLAGGGLVTGSTLAQVGEAGSEAVLPLSTAVLRDLGRSIAAAMPAGAAAGARAAGQSIHVERVVLPPPPAGDVPDPRFAAVQFARELARRGVGAAAS